MLLSSYSTAKCIENSANSDLGESHNLAQTLCPFIKANKANYTVSCAKSLNDTVHVHVRNTYHCLGFVILTDVRTPMEGVLSSTILLRGFLNLLSLLYASVV